MSTPMSTGDTRVGTCVLLVALCAAQATAQSTTAMLSGTVYDEQRGTIGDAVITLENRDTGSSRHTVSDQTGSFHMTGLVPGPYVMRVEREGFAPYLHSGIVLTIGQDAQIEAVMKVASFAERVTVTTANISAIEATKTALSRTFTSRDLDLLPVSGRDFTTLATLTPGVLPDFNQGGGSMPNLTGFAAAGQTGRNNTILVDGASHDDALPGAMRGGLPLDAVREFVVVTNGFAAEYGQASGAVVNVLTRSGTNEYAARGLYYQRHDKFDATPGSARIAVPPLDKASLAQRIAGGSAGGPIRPSRSFFFAAVEHLVRETDHVVTSPMLRLFRPDDPAKLPQALRSLTALGRVDLNATESNTLTARYRADHGTGTNRFTEPDVRLGTRERAHALIKRDQDLAIIDTQIVEGRGFNELRFLFARRFVDLNVDRYCPGCPAENRPSIRLGKSFNLPQERTEDRWQLADTMTWVLANRLGDHALKTGFDVSFVREHSFFPLNFAGTFTFTHDRPFDPAEPATYPAQYTASAGPADVRLADDMYAMFLQDQWQIRRDLTVNAGLRWDYEHAPGISHDRNNLAPRVGIGYHPAGSRIAWRASYGHYYDQLFLLVARDVEQATTLVQTRISNPGYPDPFGPNPRRTGSSPFVPSTTVYGDNMQTAYTSQATVGFQLALAADTSLAIDAVSARGYHLVAARDLNYPNLDDPLRSRPNRNFQVVQAYETRGNSWYKALHVALQRRHVNRVSFFVGYTLSTSERDTEDFRFMPQDQREYAADRGPGANDSRHRFAANTHVQLPFGLHAASVVVARSGLPYNVTTGADDNRDGFFTDRPSGVGRNSARGDAFLQADVRLSKRFRMRRVGVEVVAEAFNVTNRKNWIGHLGDLNSPRFGKPTSATAPREVQLGVRIDY